MHAHLYIIASILLHATGESGYSCKYLKGFEGNLYLQYGCKGLVLPTRTKTHLELKLKLWKPAKVRECRPLDVRFPLRSKWSASGWYGRRFVSWDRQDSPSASFLLLSNVFSAATVRVTPLSWRYKTVQKLVIREKTKHKEKV
ncbi:unnamed protein product [Brassica rapa subsp. trilocularis]